MKWLFEVLNVGIVYYEAWNTEYVKCHNTFNNDINLVLIFTMKHVTQREQTTLSKPQIAMVRKGQGEINQKPQNYNPTRHYQKEIPCSANKMDS